MKKEAEKKAPAKTAEPKIKKTSKGAIAAIIIGTVLFIGAIIVGIILLVAYFVQKDFVGTWVCDNDIKIVIDDEFEIYKNDTLSTKDDYSIKKIDINNDEKKYQLDVNDKEYVISINNKNMYMVEKDDYTIFRCTKKEN